MNAFEWEQWRALQEFDRSRRHEQMMGIDISALRRQRDFLGSQSATFEALNKLSTNPSYRWAMEEPKSAITEAARVANLSAIDILNKSRFQTELANYETLSPRWSERMQLIRGSTANALNNAVESHLFYMAEMSVLAESSLARFAWEDLGRSVMVADALLTGLRNQVLAFTQSYASLMDSFGQSHQLILAIPPSVSELTAQEFFLGSRLVKSISVERPEDELEEESEELESQIAIVLEDELQAMLAQLNPDLINLIKGARQAFRSTNADRVRHVITSYRELNMHVLHLLSPDKKVQEWSRSPDDFANGRPTRKARLKFICRKVNHGTFDEFVNTDIETMVKVFDFLNKGTHEVTTNFTEPQLLALRAKAESTVQFMLAISQE